MGLARTARRTIKIGNAAGLHARAAAKLVQLAARFKSELKISHGRCTANAKSIMGVMMLAAANGAPLTIRARGPDARKAVDAVVRLIQGKFGEGK
ncbi:HPr family phosphocarrier protein [bacterium]|nr:HPr family phosphocarrier protein [bacterium]